MVNSFRVPMPPATRITMSELRTAMTLRPLNPKPEYITTVEGHDGGVYTAACSAAECAGEIPTDNPPCWPCTSTTRPGMPSSSPVTSTQAAAAIFLPSRTARSSTRCKPSAESEVLAEPITPIFISGLCMVLSRLEHGALRRRLAVGGPVAVVTPCHTVGATHVLQTQVRCLLSTTPQATLTTPGALLPFRRRAMPNTISPVALRAVQHMGHPRASLSSSWCYSSQIPREESRSPTLTHLLPIHQLFRNPIMLFQHRPHIHGRQLPFLHHPLAVHHHVICLLRGAEDDRSNRVVHSGASVVEATEVEGKKVGAHA